MTTQMPWSLDDETLWEGLAQYVHSTMGDVGITKMMQVRDEEAGKRRWAAKVRPLLDALATVVPVKPDGPAKFAFSDGVVAQFHIHHLTVAIGDETRARTHLYAEPAAVILAMIGHARWRERWHELLAAQGVVPQVVPNSDPPGGIAALDWIAQRPPMPGPWTSAESEIEARTVGIAEILGFDTVSRLFRAICEESS